MDLVQFILKPETVIFTLGILAGSYGTLLLTWPRRKNGGRG